MVVQDAIPPDLVIELVPAELWSPNHTFREIEAIIRVSDNCDADPEVRLVSIESSEPDDVYGGGDGASSPDITGAEFGTDDRRFFLRAERQGRGDGREYVVTYEAVDRSGNRTLREAVVSVGHGGGAGLRI